MITTLDELMKMLASELNEAGTTFSEPQLAKSTRECRDEIYPDNVAHGGSIEDPFFDFTIADSVAIFTFFDEPFEFYIFPCDESALISKFTEFAMVDVEPCRQYLHDAFGKNEADISVPRWLAETWMEQC